MRPPVTSTAPGRPRCLSLASSLCDGTYFRMPAIARMPAGTFTKKHHCQPRYCVSTPPRKTPTAPPPADTMLQTLSARLRSSPSSNVVSRMERAAGAMNAAANPCRARNTMSRTLELVRPRSKEKSENPPIPSSSRRRRPNTSAIRPPSIKKPPKVRI